MERRDHPRFRANFDTLASSGRTEGSGVLTNISYSGACLENTSLHPDLGTKVCLYIFIQPVSPFELRGEVVRLDENGFAICYSIEDPTTRQLVDDVAALVTS